ncbi:zinc ribbon domain-containing protein [Nonomuraea sp. NPDC050202]|uniref:zinc ribbon domain-containing protein n=1 Tax=Nonomuraea sp. NPDC050202 TaxID=3155035 RepID=UPI0033DE7D56
MGVQAYRFAIDPTPTQARALTAHCGAARFAFNWRLAVIKANLRQRAAERSYGIPDGRLTPPVSWSMYALRKAWNAVKDTVAPWWRDCSKEAFACGLERLAAALKSWSDSRAGKRKGRRMGFPSFRSKRNPALSVRFTTGAIRLDGRMHVLPRLGRIKTHESTRKLARHIAAGVATIASATVRREAGRWFVSFSVRIDRPRKAPTRPVAGMVKNRRLARAISDAGFTEIRRQLAYKTVWDGGRLVVADRWYPSSKRCSACGVAKAKLPLSARTFSCEACGLVIDRDRNAALNLASLVHDVAGSGPETETDVEPIVRPRRAGQVAPKRQPRTGQSGKTGTFAQQWANH